MVPVSGKVIVDGKPLTKGQIGFIPDASQGNTRPEYSIGEIEVDGTFQLKTLGQSGARLGWYKVVVWASANEPDQSHTPGVVWKPEWLVHAKYTNAETTDLVREVTESAPPGAYDFDLRK